MLPQRRLPLIRGDGREIHDLQRRLHGGSGKLLGRAVLHEAPHPVRRVSCLRTTSRRHSWRISPLTGPSSRSIRQVVRGAVRLQLVQEPEPLLREPCRSGPERSARRTGTGVDRLAEKGQDLAFVFGNGLLEIRRQGSLWPVAAEAVALAQKPDASMA